MQLTTNLSCIRIRYMNVARLARFQGDSYELAPRPHNSGHFTIDASVTSQFEQQVRAVCCLPLGSTEIVRPAAMANLMGDLWCHGEPNWDAACAFPGVKLHLHGKTEPRAGRKMGHLTAVAPTAAEAELLVTSARQALLPQSQPTQLATGHKEHNAP